MTNKTALHPNNKHRQGYDFNKLLKSSPSLSSFIIKNKYNQQDTIDFSNGDAVKSLNSALLKHYYGINYWDFPQGYLCPPIPGRADYIHHLNDLLKKEKIDGEISIVDIGTGASCIYPILGASEYDWTFTASDIDPVSIKAAKVNINANKKIASLIDCRLQKDSKSIFKGIIKPNEFYHATMCNPPFHESLAAANTGSNKKWKNLNKHNKASDKKDNKAMLNFGGQKAELWCDGGEVAFIRQMIKESKQYRDQITWFTCLVSKKDNLSKIKLYLKKAHVSKIEVINMAQGQKISRFIAWTFS